MAIRPRRQTAPKRGFKLKQHIKGLKEVQKRFEQIVKDLSGNPMMAGIAKAVLLVERAAKKNAPVDTGRLRASITPDVVTRDTVIKGVVGSNVKYAPYQEFGTRPHWPPWAPIFRWAMRKTKGDRKAAGAITASVRRKIAAVGTEGTRFLQRALEDNAPRIARLINNAVAGIIKRGGE